MLFAGDASEWLLPMPVTLVAVMLVFSLWRRILPRQRRLRRSVAAVVVVAFVRDFHTGHHQYRREGAGRDTADGGRAAGCTGLSARSRG